MTRKPSVAIVGSGALAAALAPALRESGYIVAEIVSRAASSSRRRARLLALQVGGSANTIQSAQLDADLLWLCVPDREIGSVAASLAGRALGKIRCAFHSSGALTSRELDPLRRRGLAAASVHPLMTFVAGGRPSLSGVPFAIEGDDHATRIARRIVRDLGGEGFALPATRKPSYHAWATMTSPLLLAFLVNLEEAARAAGMTPEDSRRKSLPIIRQTLENYARLGPQHSFSGPIIRGDVETVAQHLKVLERLPAVREVYSVLAKSAIGKLPPKNRKELQRLLRADRTEGTSG